MPRSAVKEFVMARISTSSTQRRSGVALLIVIAMLALLAMVGLSFAFYAEYESDSARFLRMVQTNDAYDLEPEKLFSYGLGQLIFGVDQTKAPKSQIYRLSLAESIYNVPGGTVPFNGIGHQNPDTKKHSQVVWNESVGLNVPYTYPDLNNLFLARVDADGKITHRSFFRNGEPLRPKTPPFTPLPVGGEGDVRNMNSTSGPFVNDAFWMDLDFPIHVAKDGTRFKPLFAFTVIDLDGRVNLAVAGNHNVDYANAGGVSSRCGLGPWEINPAKVLASTGEIKELFKSSSNSRYGSDGAPDQAAKVNTMGFSPTPAYGRVDYTGKSTTGPMSPATNSHFTTYNWLDLPDPTPGKTEPHPAGYDYFNAAQAGGTDRVLSPYNVEPLLRWRDRGSAALTSDLFRLLKTNLTPTNSWTSKRELFMVTPLSTSLDTAHLAPLMDGTMQGAGRAARYTMNPGEIYPKLETPNKGMWPTQIPPPGPQGDFSANGMSQIAAAVRRINLNRPLANETDKQQLVQEIFDRLVRVTGATPPTANAPFTNPDRTDPRYMATRWLAQYAVNIVDFIDADDIMTKFKWNPHSNDKADFVFGVEHNRLMINEVFVTVDNVKEDQGIQAVDPKDRKGTKYRINAWAELFNPMTNQSTGGGQTTLFKGNQPHYRLLMAESTAGINDSPTGTPTLLCYDGKDANRGRGVIDWNASTTVPTGVVSFGDRQLQGKNGQGFYIVGPKDDHFINEKGYQIDWSPLQIDLKSSGMTSREYTQNFQGKTISEAADLEPMTNITLVLQKLVDPNLGENNDSSDPARYNPFVTVDYFVAPKITPSQANPQDPDKNPSDITVEPSHVIAKYVSDKPPAKDPPEFEKLHSTGRQQPIRGQLKTCYYQNPQTTEPCPQHTFGKQNLKTDKAGKGVPLDPFLPYFHFDRALMNTAELMTVECVPPMQFTQSFGTPTLTAQSAFNDVNSMLVRFFETVTVGDRSYNSSLALINGGAPLGAGLKHAILVPGKINLNAQPAKEVISALFDAQTGAGQTLFQQTDVDNFHQDLLTLNRPIAGFGDYRYENGMITARNTLFQDDNNPPRPLLFGKMFQAATTAKNEYEKTEALRKVMNNITFTSNTFAVWITVGFFEVDAAGNPTKEIGAQSGTNIRHRMFAVVDRSQLMIPDSGQLQQGITTLAAAASKSPDGITPSPLVLAADSGTVKAPTVTGQMPKLYDFNWKLKSGMALTIDRGNPQLEETVMINVDPNTGKISTAGPLRHNHAAGAQVTLGGIYGAQVPANKGTNYNFILGHPGPQPNFNLREYSYVVPYFTLID
jgi:hypothetical protein